MKRRSSNLRHNILAVQILFLIISSLLFIYFIYFAYSHTVKPIELNELDLIVPASTPIKIAPKEPGGMKIPNQESLVYQDDSADAFSIVD